MKKETALEKDTEDRQGMLFPEIVKTKKISDKKQKTGKEKRALKKERVGPDSQIEKMSPKEFGEFLRNRDKARYEKAKLILEEERIDE